MSQNNHLDAAWQYHSGTKHSPLSVRMNPHFLDWENKPLLFKIYPTLEVMRLPRDFRETGSAASRLPGDKRWSRPSPISRLWRNSSSSPPGSFGVRNTSKEKLFSAPPPAPEPFMKSNFTSSAPIYRVKLCPAPGILPAWRLASTISASPNSACAN